VPERGKVFLPLAIGFLLAGCGDPEVVPIARGKGAEPPFREQRGRVQIIDGRLVTDRGTRLRGVAIEADLGLDFELYAEPEGARPALRSFFEKLTGELGLNAFELNLESYNVEAGSRAGFADVMVEESRRAGAYLILGPGSGPARDGKGGSGWFDPDFVGRFWTFYAPRYASETHVLYQIQKVPERTCDALWNDASLSLERDMYSLIRGPAPDTHVLTFSFGEIPTVAAFEANVSAVVDTVSFAHATVAFHAHDECAPVTEVAMLPREIAGQTISLFVTELPPNTWQENLRAMEEDKVGWMHYHWIALDPELASFRPAHDEAGIGWCPDFGTWPQNSSTCSDQ
jgi:hypothetical protein